MLATALETEAETLVFLTKNPAAFCLKLINLAIAQL